MKEYSESNRKLTKDNLIKMMEFLVSNMFSNRSSEFMFVQIVPLLVEIFLYSNNAELIQRVLSMWKKESVKMKIK